MKRIRALRPKESPVRSAMRKDTFQDFGPNDSAREAVPSIRVITTNTDFDSLEREWNALLAKAPSTVFQTFEWLRTWWKYRAEKNQSLNILLFYSGYRLAGIAPLFAERTRYAGVTLYTRLRFLGAGLSDYVDLIVEPSMELPVLEALVTYLDEHSRDWDIFEIESVNEVSPLVLLLPDLFKKKDLRTYLYQSIVCPYMLLPNSTAVLWANLGSTSRTNYGRKLRKLQTKFNATIRLYSRESDDLGKAVEDFSVVHGGRWKSLGYPSAFDDPRMKEYHIEFSRSFARRGWLRLYVLYVDDQPAAACYAFHYNGRIYMYHCNAHCSDEVMKTSPGFAIRWAALEQGIREEMKVLDYLRGDEAYKYREWEVSDSKNYLVQARSPRSWSLIPFLCFLGVRFLQKAVDRGKREYYNFRRFRITRKSSPKEMLAYAVRTAGGLLALSWDFIVRHSPLRDPE